jgi:hypothetical protein
VKIFTSRLNTTDLRINHPGVTLLRSKGRGDKFRAEYHNLQKSKTAAKKYKRSSSVK